MARFTRSPCQPVKMTCSVASESGQSAPGLLEHSAIATHHAGIGSLVCIVQQTHQMWMQAGVERSSTSSLGDKPLLSTFKAFAAFGTGSATQASPAKVGITAQTSLYVAWIIAFHNICPLK